MKKSFVLLFALFAMVLVASPIKPIKKVINVDQSEIAWTASKITGKHNGTVKLKSGSITVDANKLIAGSFIMDMPTITVTDLQGGGKDKLEGHLKSDDFFGIEKFTESTLTITKVSPKGMPGEFLVNADLTIKGIKQPITFEAKLDANIATAKIKVDRTKFDIKYGSGSFFDNLGDKAINDNFDLDVKIAF